MAFSYSCRLTKPLPRSFSSCAFSALLCCIVLAALFGSSAWISFRARSLLPFGYTSQWNGERFHVRHQWERNKSNKNETHGTVKSSQLKISCDCQLTRLGCTWAKSFSFRFISATHSLSPLIESRIKLLWCIACAWICSAMFRSVDLPFFFSCVFLLFIVFFFKSKRSRRVCREKIGSLSRRINVGLPSRLFINA